jgi:hypothetical protein
MGVCFDKTYPPRFFDIRNIASLRLIRTLTRDYDEAWWPESPPLYEQRIDCRRSHSYRSRRNCDGRKWQHGSRHEVFRLGQIAGYNNGSMPAPTRL